MPLYDYECGSCGKEFEDIRRIADRKKSPCSCGGVGTQFLKPGHGPGLSIFKAEYYRDLGRNGTFINSPQELRDACDRNGSQSTYLENSTFRTSPGPDPIGVRGQDPAVNNQAFGTD